MSRVIEHVKMISPTPGDHMFEVPVGITNLRIALDPDDGDAILIHYDRDNPVMSTQRTTFHVMHDFHTVDVTFTLIGTVVWNGTSLHLYW